MSIATVAQAKNLSVHPSIINGTPVSSISTTPFIVQFYSQQNGGVQCGGTVIAPTWILTAGHCQEVLNMSDLKIFAGSLTQGSGTLLSMKAHYVHPQFSNGNRSVSHDYMLIQLKKPINFKKTNIKALTLANSNTESRGLQDPGTMTTVAGWGNLSQSGGNYPNQLYSVQVPIVDFSTANASNAYDGSLDSSMLAAGYAQGGKDSCDGDSGGPLFTYDSQKGKNILVGVVSFGQGCALANKYGIYAKVTEGLSWITQTIQTH